MTSHRLRSDYMCEFSPFSLPFFLFFPIQFLPHNMGYYDVGQVEVVSDAWFLFFLGFPLPLCYSISATIHGAMRCRRVYIVDVSSHMLVCAAARLIYIVRDLSTVRGAYTWLMAHCTIHMYFSYIYLYISSIHTSWLTHIHSSWRMYIVDDSRDWRVGCGCWNEKLTRTHSSWLIHSSWLTHIHSCWRMYIVDDSSHM